LKLACLPFLFDHLCVCVGGVERANKAKISFNMCVYTTSYIYRFPSAYDMVFFCII
jgi:hypothetical protein